MLAPFGMTRSTRCLRQAVRYQCLPAYQVERRQLLAEGLVQTASSFLEEASA